MSPSRDLLRWPALSGLAVLPDSLPIERGVWGKVHGQSSEFRWIARSPGLVESRAALERELGLGYEDQPRDAVCWRVLGDLQVALHVYPSRARDAAGRTGFLEKQMLVLRSRSRVPAALVAMMLLPRVGELSDEVWWPYRDETSWWDPEFALTLDGGQSPPLAVTESGVAAAIERGVRALKVRVAHRDLTRFYADLLARRRPAALHGLADPLPAEALAVLLLPLPPEHADTVSLAGWLPSTRAPADELAERWSGVVAPPGLLPAPPAEIDLGSPAAGELAAALLDARPDALAQRPVSDRQDSPAEPAAVASALQLRAEVWRAGLAGRLPRPGLLLPLTEPTGGSPLVHIYEFARAADRRWLDLDQLDLVGQRSRLALAPDTRLLPLWVKEAAEFWPPGADPDQWETKVELLRKAAHWIVPVGIDL